MSFTVTGQVKGVQEKGGKMFIRVDAPTRVKFNRGDCVPVPQDIEVPDNIPLDGIGHGQEVTVTGQCACGKYDYIEQNSFGKPTGRTKPVFVHNFVAESVRPAAAKKAS